MAFVFQIESESSMKLLFVAPSAYLLGGVQDWLYLTTLGLRNRGHIVDVAIPNNRFHNGILYNQHYNGIHAVHFSNQSGSSEGRIRSLAKLLLRRPADLIVGVNIGDVYEAYKRVSSRLGDTRLAMTLHAIEGDYLGDIGRYHNLIDGVITTNRLSERIVKELSLIEPERIFYSPYGVKPAYSRQLHGDLNSLRIAWVGRLDDSQKRVSDLYGILNCLDTMGIDYMLSIAGDGPSRQELEQRLAFWIGKGKARILGFLNKQQLDNLYSEHNILLITSEWETGPIVAWEAMSAGLAVVSSKYVGHASEKALINGDTALLYPVSSCMMAANQLKRLCDPELRVRISVTGQQMAVNRYSAETSIHQWEDTFKKIMSSNKRVIARNQGFSLNNTRKRIQSGFVETLREKQRALLKRDAYCFDAGSEWPHSLYGPTNQDNLLRYAKSLEADA
ncbi:MAG: glycosyltransferase family 4 protein [Cyanobacteriota bacterium]